MGDVVRRYRHCIARTDRQQSLGRQDAIPVQRIRARRWQPGTPRRSPQFGSPQHDIGCDGCVVERGLDLVKTLDTGNCLEEPISGTLIQESRFSVPDTFLQIWSPFQIPSLVLESKLAASVEAGYNSPSRVRDSELASDETSQITS